MENEKSFLQKIKEKITVKKRIALMVVAVVATVCVFIAKGPDKMMATGGKGTLNMGVRTTVLQLSTLTESVSVTGTVESTRTVNITSTVTGVSVSEILVQEGDKVAVGDVIAKLDTTDILKNIVAKFDGGDKLRIYTSSRGEDWSTFASYIQ